MPGVFDRLQNQLEIRKREEGISPLDIADLPPELRKVMRLMLREVVIKYADLCAAFTAQDARNRLGQVELDTALDKLVEQNWLRRRGAGELMTYQVNLRRKAGSNLDTDIWSALENRMSTSKGHSGSESE